MGQKRSQLTKNEKLGSRTLLRLSASSSLPIDRLMSLSPDRFVQVSASLGIVEDVSALSSAGDSPPFGRPRPRVVSACVPVENKALTRVPVLVTIHSLTMTSGGTAISNAISSGPLVPVHGLRESLCPSPLSQAGKGFSPCLQVTRGEQCRV